jgi:DNA polymerase III subunit alpha
VASPEEIVAAAVEQKMPAVALTDSNGLYAAVPFYQAAKNARIKPIVGVTLDVTMADGGREIPRLRADKNHRLSAGNDSFKGMSLVLLATDMEGYSNLCQLVTLRHLGTAKLACPGRLAQNMGAAETDGRPVTVQELAEHSRGVIVLCPLPARARDVGAHRGAASTISNYFSQLKELFSDRLYIEVQHLSPGDGRTLREAERIGRELGVPLVATNDVHFLRPKEHLHHRAVNAIRTGALLTTVTAPEITTGEAWFKPAVEMQTVFPDHPEWLQRWKSRSAAIYSSNWANSSFRNFPCPKANPRFRICGS